MAVEVRPIPDGDLERANFIIAYSFAGDRSPEGRMRHVESMGVALGLYEDGEMAACLRIFPMASYIHGASIPMGGVTGVASLPEHRRKGYVGELLRQALVTMREQGQSISTLYTPHPSLYRRYGWMFASSVMRYRFNPKEIALVSGGKQGGRAHRATEEDLPALAGVYRRFAAPRNGYLDRDERWWREAVFHEIFDAKRTPVDIVVWSDVQGQPSGYAAYKTGHDSAFEGPGFDRLLVRELVALDSDAYLGILRYVLSHDLVREVAWWGPEEDPLALAVSDPGRVKRERWDGFMLRIVDVEKAVAARPPAAGAPEGAFTVRLTDASAPWNQGAWRIECSVGGRLSASKAEGAAGISTDVSTFAAMYNGFLRPTDAVRAGLAEADDAEAASLADRMLAADYRPFTPDFY